MSMKVGMYDEINDFVSESEGIAMGLEYMLLSSFLYSIPMSLESGLT